MEWLIAIPVILVVVVFVRSTLHRHATVVRRADEASLAEAVSDASSVSDGDRRDGRRRAARSQGRVPGKFAALVVIGQRGASDDGETYRAAFELIVRGISVNLEMQEIYQERGGIGLGGMDISARPVVHSRVNYTTEAFAPYLREIGSIEDFQRYAPYRADHHLVLTVHPEDERDAYVVLREQGVRLSVFHHPGQHWWKDEEASGD